MKPKYKIIAHRGYHTQEIKENTYLSLIKALNHPQISGIEFDIRLTKDQQIVIIHDHSTIRTTLEHRLVESSTLNELKKLNYGSKQYPSSISALDKILKITTSKLLIIEIKCHHNEKLFAKIISQKLSNITNKNIYLISFNKKVLNYLKTDFPKAIITINQINYHSDFIVTRYQNIEKIKPTQKEIFLYTIDSYKNISPQNSFNIYYICDNLNQIIPHL